MPKPFPPEFRRDVIAVARKGEASIAQIARDFGISESCLARWLRIADREDTLANTSDAADDRALQVENRELRKRTKQLEQENEVLRWATATSPATCSKMIYPLVRELAAEKIPVAVTCRVLGFSKQAFYKWQAQPVSQRDWDDAHLINAAYDIHHDDPGFGYRFIADELPAHGVTAEAEQAGADRIHLAANEQEYAGTRRLLLAAVDALRDHSSVRAGARAERAVG